MTPVRRVIVNGLLVVVTSASAATDATAQTCLASVYRSYADAQRTWQVSLQDLIVSSRPDYAELASLSAELQLAMIEQSEDRFVYLMTQQPDRVRATDDLTRFVNVGVQWTPGDEQALLAANPQYRALSARIDSLRTLNDGHPDWPALREYFASDLSIHDDYTAALERLRQRQVALEEDLTRCATG